MKITTLRLKNIGATLTCYIHDCDGIIPADDLRRGVFVIPGGSYEYCSTREGEPVALAYVAKGFNAFLLHYSTSCAHWPMPLDDAMEAYNLVLDNCDTWHTDSTKIAVVGFSAGGHLAAAMCLLGGARPGAMVLGYPCLADPQCSSMAMLPPPLLGTATKACPPCFIFSTFEDALVPVTHSLDFARELATLEINVECHIFAHGEHGLSLAENFCANGKAFKMVPQVSQWFDMSVRWLYDLFGEYTAKEQPYVFPTAEQLGFCVDIVPKPMLENAECLAILEQFYPGISQPERAWGARKVPVRIFNSRLPDNMKITDAQMENLDSLLRKIKP